MSAPPLVVAIDMGYGHLRAAHPLAERLGTVVYQCDRPPLADAAETRRWRRARASYELVCRASQLPIIGAPMRTALEQLTAIPPLHPARDLSPPTAAARWVRRLCDEGLGQGLSREMRRTGQALLTTFYTPAITADAHGTGPTYCVVTDSDINRIWAPIDAGRSNVRYFAPSRRVVRRLTAFGVRPERIRYTGFPLPHELLGGAGLPALRTNLRRRLSRLDPAGSFMERAAEEVRRFLGECEPATGPPTLAFLVGGAGAQLGLAQKVVRGLQPLLLSGRLRLMLVAGVREEVLRSFEAAIAGAQLERLRDDDGGGAIEVLYRSDVITYLERFNQRLADVDVAWTKPSEMSFYAALGLPLILAPPIGMHEDYNRRWVKEAGAGVDQREPEQVAHWLAEWLEDGALAGMAWAGYRRLPQEGLYRILEEVAAAAPEVC
jgi:hypothetical protein